MSSATNTGMSRFPTLFVKAIESLICSPTTDIPLILVCMLIVPTTMRLIELFGATM
ncbi:hypothetical protein LINPERHAP2_LOCUS22863 [Linum perenne]